MQFEFIETALQKGIINETQAAALRNLAERARPEAPASALEPGLDDEDLKFIGGFGDIFVTIGLGLFLGASIYFGSLFGGAVGAYGTAVVLSWLLAEYFTRQRRMALTSIVLFAVFVVCSAALFAHLLAIDWTLLSKQLDQASLEGGVDRLRRLVWGRVILTFLLTVALSAAYYARFRVPIAVAGAVAALCGIVLSALSMVAPGLTESYFNPIILALGLGVFALAMRFDTSDPSRRTRRSDIAFWLHLLAAPLTVHPLLGPVLEGGTPTQTQALLIIGVFLLMGLIALIIDRRAVLLSSMTYAGISFGTLLRHTGITEQTTPVTILVLGAFILLISAGWHPLRRVVLSFWPASITKYLHNPDGLAATPPPHVRTLTTT